MQNLVKVVVVGVAEVELQAGGEGGGAVVAHLLVDVHDAVAQVQLIVAIWWS